MVGILWGVLGTLAGVGRRLGVLQIDLGCDMGEKVLSLDKGMRELGGEVEGCREEVIVPEVLHLQQQRLLRCTFLCFTVFHFLIYQLSNSRRNQGM